MRLQDDFKLIVWEFIKFISLKVIVWKEIYVSDKGRAQAAKLYTDKYLNQRELPKSKYCMATSSSLSSNLCFLKKTKKANDDIENLIIQARLKFKVHAERALKIPDEVLQQHIKIIMFEIKIVEESPLRISRSDALMLKDSRDDDKPLQIFLHLKDLQRGNVSRKKKKRIR